MSEMRLVGRSAIEAYISEAGLICLSQEDDLGNDPSIICMLHTDIPQIIEWLQQLARQFPLKSDA